MKSKRVKRSKQRSRRSRRASPRKPSARKKTRSKKKKNTISSTRYGSPGLGEDAFYILGQVASTGDVEIPRQLVKVDRFWRDMFPKLPDVPCTSPLITQDHVNGKVGREKVHIDLTGCLDEKVVEMIRTTMIPDSVRSFQCEGFPKYALPIVKTLLESTTNQLQFLHLEGEDASNDSDFPFDLLGTHTNLISLKLRDMKFQNVIKLADALNNLTNLTSLDLSNNQIPIDNLTFPTTLKELDLSNITYTEGPTKFLENILGTLTNLEMFYFRGHYLNEINVKVLLEKLQKLTKLRELNLTANNLNSGNNKQLVNTLNSLPLLTELYLAENQLTDEHVRDLTSLPKLQILDLSVNQLRGTVQFDGSSLRILYLSRNQISVIQYIQDIPDTSQLETLDLQSNVSSPDDSANLELLKNKLQRLIKLRTIALRDVGLTDERNRILRKICLDLKIHLFE